MEARARSRHRYTYEDYLALEADSSVKHEFLDGEIFAMAGGTPEHAALAMAVAVALGSQLGAGPCRLFSSDLRVRIRATGLTTYPDVTVVYGPIERDPESASTVVNPTVVVEVTSPGTEDYDRGEKLEHYQRAPSLAAVLFVSHREPAIELWSRGDDGWTSRRAGAGESLRVEPISVSVDVDAVYAGVLDAL